MTNANDAPAYTRSHWAKSDRQDHRRIHLLEHHLADVGACFEELLAQPTIRQRLAHSGGLDTLDDATAARLALFAALHDIGKVNTGFQTQIWRDADLPAGQRRPGRAGHTLDLTPLLNDKDEETGRRFFDALGWWLEATESWDDRDGETVSALFIAALSHHGLPLQMKDGRSRNPAIWRSFGGLDPEACVRRIGGLAQQWFPAAFAPNAPPLPSDSAFQHHFLGLCSLADWIGSNEAWFEYVRKILGLPRVLAGVEVRCTGPRRSGATSADVDRGCRMPTGASLHLARPLRLRDGGTQLQALVVFGKAPWCQRFPEGEQMEIAGLHATVAISKEPLPARADLSVWQATVWLPVSVIRVVATTITEDPEGNPFNSELGLTATLSLLMELR